MLKKIALSLFIVSFLFIAQANAQTEVPAEKRAAIKELIALVNADNKTEDFMNIFTAQMETMRAATIAAVLDENKDLSAADKKALQDILVADAKAAARRFQEKLMQKLNFNEMIDEIATIVYDKYFSLAEIKELTAFYRTPTGQKALKTMTPLMTDTMQMTSERIAPKIPVVLKEIQDEEKLEIERLVNARKQKGKKPDTK